MRPERGSFRIRALIALFMLGLVTATVACEDDGGPLGRDDDVATVEITTAPQTLEIGTTSQLAFEIRDADGNLIDPDDVTIDFTSTAATVATVSETGLVTPVAVGTTTVTLEAGGISDTITIDVIAEITSIDIVETELNVITDETLGLEITVLDAAGQPVTDPSLTFTSSDQSIVSVDGDGNLTAEGEGVATITVSGGGASDTIEISVFPAASGGISLGGTSFTAQTGDAVDITGLVVVRDAGGIVIPDAELTFTTTDAAVATVDEAGMLTPLAVGSTLIIVTSPDADGSAAFRLTVLEAGSVEAIEVDPATASVAVDATVDLVIAAEADGAPITDFLAVFSSSDETVAVVDPFTGVVTGIAPGVATITVVNGDLTSEAEITVQ
jgi:uncharacterized protein YjdB